MSYSKGDIILLPYPFSDLKSSKVRPAVVVAAADGRYADLFVVPITSRVSNLNNGEFIISDWAQAGLNVVSAIKRGCVLVDAALIKLKVGVLPQQDIANLNKALRSWLELQ